MPHRDRERNGINRDGTVGSFLARAVDVAVTGASAARHPSDHRSQPDWEIRKRFGMNPPVSRPNVPRSQWRFAARHGLPSMQLASRQ
jgi:hypothetical protein